MYSRQTMLAMSILSAVLFYGGFFALAPSLNVHTIVPPKQRVASLFKVQVREAVPAPQPQTEEKQGDRLASSPGSIRDLLDNETEALSPMESLLNKSVEVPQLSERVASEVVEREHHLDPLPDAEPLVNARIIEISQDTARANIEIARRFVQPSPERILGENEFPVLRGPSDAEPEPILPSLMPTTSLLGQPIGGGGASGGDDAPPAPEAHPALSGAVAELAPVHPPALERMAPIVQQIEKENPYEFMDDMLDINLETYVPPGESQGYFRLRLLPKKDKSPSALPKDVTFVIDASNSIAQRKLDQTVVGLRGSIEQLRPEDRFNIVVFRDNPTTFSTQRVEASPANKAAAIEFLKGVQSRGQTDVYNAIKPVLQEPPRPGIPGIVLLMSDGRPTTGVRDARTIINSLSTENELGNTIFAYGGGNTVDRYLLDLLALRNKGDSFVSKDISGISKDLPAFFGSFKDPLLVELRTDFGSIDEAQVFPKSVPDFYKERAVTVYGRYDPASQKEFAMRLTGEAEFQKKEVIFKADLAEADSGKDDIARNWALNKVYYLIGEMCRVGEKPELLAEVRELSRKYGIKTSYDE